MLRKFSRNNGYPWVIAGLLTLSAASVIAIETLKIGTPFLTVPALF